MTLTEFLLARIAEDEATAREACAFGHWSATVDWISDGHDSGMWESGCEVLDEEDSHHEDDPTVRGEHMLIYDEGGHNVAHARHIALHDPARVLAECEEKREILTQCDDGLKYGAEDAGGTFEDILGLLAAVYADHLEFQQAWKP